LPNTHAHTYEIHTHKSIYTQKKKVERPGKKKKKKSRKNQKQKRGRVRKER